MELIRENWQFIVGVIGLIGGYFDLKNVVKHNQDGLLESASKISQLESSLVENEKKDAVLRTEIDSLSKYKDESSRTKDQAVIDLAEIKGLLVGVKEGLSDIKREYHDLRKELHRFKDKTNSK